MLFTTKTLNGDPIRARDGDVGTVKDVYFDDEKWAVRYLVVDTGGWLPGKKVLISPAAVLRGGDVDAIRVSLTREQVKAAPDVDTDAPISRVLEAAQARHYGYPYYWSGPLLWGVGTLPVGVPPDGIRQKAPVLPEREMEEAARIQAAESHLRSSAEVIGYSIRATDGEIGHVEDFLVDTESWAIAGVVVDTRNWLPGGKVVVSPDQVIEIDWEARQAGLGLTREQIRSAPGTS